MATLLGRIGAEKDIVRSSVFCASDFGRHSVAAHRREARQTALFR
jgi:hypothetical protein